MTLRPDIRRWLIVALVALGAIAAFMVVRKSRQRSTAPAVVIEPVERRNIVLTIEATGTVEPINLVEVKSKASGQIVRMPVQVGSVVRAGQLLAQIDTRDVRNQYDQNLAALRAAQAKVDVSRAQKKRADDLFGQNVITADEYESATLDFANAQAQLVKARTDLDLARQRLEDATVSAPIAGTVLEQLVSTGQVISSATSSASGGTSLLKMADLSRIRLRAMVNETDIGNVRPGQTATVAVEAFPNRNFTAQVEKVEPQAVVQQSVTMFPVLISISNEDGLLLPGMNGEVTMLVQRRDGVLAVPVDAVRSVRELPVVAAALGLNPDSVQAQVERQVQARAAERASRVESGASVAAAEGQWAAGATSTPDSARVRARAQTRRGGDSTGTGDRTIRGGGGRQGRRGEWSRSGSGAGSGGGSSSGQGQVGGAAGGGSGAGGGGTSGRGNRAQVVFVKTPRGLEPRVVRLGLSDFDYAEILDGVKEGEQVALVGVAEAQAQRTQSQDRIRQRMGSGMPGVPGGGGGTRGGSGGGRSSGGGGGRSGGGS